MHDTGDDCIAVIEEDGSRWTHSDIKLLSYRLSHALIRDGLSQGDAIAVIAPNCFEYLALLRAAIISGLYLVPINWHLPHSETVRILRDSKAKVVFVASQLTATRTEVWQASLLNMRALVSIGSDDASPGVQLDRFLDDVSDLPYESRLRGDVLAYTSGTTGLAKGVLRQLRPTRHGSTLSPKELTSRYNYKFESEGKGTHLSCAPYYHAPVLQAAGRELDKGGSIVVMQSWEPRLALELIEKHKVTSVFLVPAMMIGLLHLPESIRCQHDVSSLKVVWHSAAPCPLEIKLAMIDWWGPIIWERYGSVEGPVSMVSTEEWLKNPGTVGKPDHGVDVKILDEHHVELPRGMAGLVYIQPHPDFAFQYLEGSKVNCAASCGSYYTVGDIGYLDDQGYLFLCDRISDVIISGGVNIYPAELEKRLSEHALVADCAIMSKPHALLGEVPRALVVLVPGASSAQLSKRDLMSHLRARLAPFQLPHDIDFVDKLPRDPNGKLFRRLISSLD